MSASGNGTSPQLRRLALVIGQLTTGGAELQLCELVARLDRSRFDPVVYTLAGGAANLLPRLEGLGVPVRVVGSIGFPRARRLAAELVRERVDLVHSWLFIANTYAWLACWGMRLPLVTSARNCKSQGWGHHLANVAAFRSSARIIANSEEVREYIVARYAAPRRRVNVVYNGIDTERFRPAPRSGKETRIATVGRLVNQKNPLLFVEAAARVCAAIPETRFVVVGDGPLRASAERHAQRLCLEGKIEFLGERADVGRVLGECDVFWLTSSWEGLPNVLLEAMACGLPVIATDVGGTRELFRSGQEGFLVPPRSVDDFVHYGIALARDVSLRTEMGRRARARAEQFSLRRMVAETEAVYEKALEGRL
jgi:glycosyltransferase involved in cell wall biosynthesis